VVKNQLKRLLLLRLLLLKHQLLKHQLKYQLKLLLLKYQLKLLLLKLHLLKKLSNSDSCNLDYLMKEKPTQVGFFIACKFIC
jgi:hypothetical protein